MTLTKQGNKLIIVIDTDAEPVPSQSGKYEVVARTNFIDTPVMAPTGKPMTLSLVFGYNRK